MKELSQVSLTDAEPWVEINPLSNKRALVLQDV